MPATLEKPAPGTAARSPIQRRPAAADARHRLVQAGAVVAACLVVGWLAALAAGVVGFDGLPQLPAVGDLHRAPAGHDHGQLAGVPHDAGASVAANANAGPGDSGASKSDNSSPNSNGDSAAGGTPAGSAGDGSSGTDGSSGSDSGTTSPPADATAPGETDAGSATSPPGESGDHAPVPTGPPAYPPGYAHGLAK